MPTLIIILIGMVAISVFAIPRMQLSPSQHASSAMNEKMHEIAQIVLYTAGLIALWWHAWPKLFVFLSLTPWSIVLAVFFVWFCLGRGIHKMRNWLLRALFLSMLWAIISLAWRTCTSPTQRDCPVPVGLRPTRHTRVIAPPVRYIDTTYYTYIYDTAWYHLPIDDRDGVEWRTSVANMDKVVYQQKFSDGSFTTVPRVLIPNKTRIERVDSLGRVLSVSVANSDGIIFTPLNATDIRIVGRHRALFKIWIKTYPLQR